MNLKFDKYFLESVQKITNPSIKEKITTTINKVESADSLDNIKQLKKPKGYKSYYRIKIGDYRIGVEIVRPDTVILLLWPIAKKYIVASPKTTNRIVWIFPEGRTFGVHEDDLCINISSLRSVYW